MLIKKAPDIRYSEVTPQSLYFNRRSFLAGVPAAFLGAYGIALSLQASPGCHQTGAREEPSQHDGKAELV